MISFRQVYLVLYLASQVSSYSNAWLHRHKRVSTCPGCY